MATDFKFGTHTPFHKWIKTVKSLDSFDFAYNLQNIDIMWMNMDMTGQPFMLIEEKIQNGYPKMWQRLAYKRLHNLCLADQYYHGCHLITLENTSPNDGWIKLDNEWFLSIEELIQWLAFTGKPEWYSKDLIW